MYPKRVTAFYIFLEFVWTWPQTNWNLRDILCFLFVLYNVSDGDFYPDVFQTPLFTEFFVVQMSMIPLFPDFHLRAIWLAMKLAYCFFLFFWNYTWFLSWSFSWFLFKICSKSYINTQELDSVLCDYGFIVVYIH